MQGAISNICVCVETPLSPGMLLVIVAVWLAEFLTSLSTSTNKNSSMRIPYFTDNSYMAKSLLFCYSLIVEI